MNFRHGQLRFLPGKLWLVDVVNERGNLEALERILPVLPMGNLVKIASFQVVLVLTFVNFPCR